MFLRKLANLLKNLLRISAKFIKNFYRNNFKITSRNNSKSYICGMFFVWVVASSFILLAGPQADSTTSGRYCSARNSGTWFLPTQTTLPKWSYASVWNTTTGTETLNRSNFHSNKRNTGYQWNAVSTARTHRTDLTVWTATTYTGTRNNGDQQHSSRNDLCRRL